jgi:hypothetical protein
MVNSEAPEDVDDEVLRRLMEEVLQAERDKLHMGNPLGINDDIQSIIEEEVE